MLINKLYNRYKKPLKLYWWRYDYPNRLNFGDEITPLIIKSLFGRRCVWSPPDKCELAGAGSIIEILQNESNGNHIKIWGSSFIKDGLDDRSDNLQFFATRGELSLNRIKNGTDVALGDPGLLASHIFQASKIKKHGLGIVPHYMDANSPMVRRLAKLKGSKVIDVLQPPQKVAKDITSCEIIFSSSLHGLIFSDSFGVPNYWTPFSDRLTGGDYKFNDYYSVFAEEPHPIKNPSNLSETQIDKLIEAYSSKPGLATIQKNLINAFPF